MYINYHTNVVGKGDSEKILAVENLIILRF